MISYTCRRFPGLILSLLVTASFYGCKQETDAEERDVRPNIILILVDDLGKEWISAYGAEDISTPNIDALAANGILFNNVYAMPQCTPSRVTLLTGQYPFRHGWVNHWDVPRWGGGAHFDENLNPSIGKEMKKAGYKTCIAGKWQIDDFRIEPDALVNNGFDDYCMWTGYETGVEASANRYQDPYLFTKDGSKTYDGSFGPDVFTEFITDFIVENRAAPFFIYYPMVLTHTPFVSTPGESAESEMGKHKAMVRYADKLTGTIMEALEESGVRENTVIIWTTDNGTTGQITGDYRGRRVQGGKSRTVEPGICVPFIVSWPEQIESGQTSNALIDFSDFFPTLLDLAGIQVDDKWEVKGVEYPIDGSSFKGALKAGVDQSKRTWILSMGGGNRARLTENGVENEFKFRDRVLRNSRYKLYINSKRLPEKFIDVQLDPEENNNLLDSLTSEDRKLNFEALFSVVKTFPLQDNDPGYQPNDAQIWDVEVTAESQVWKK